MGLGGVAASSLIGCAPFSPPTTNPEPPVVDLGPFDCGIASGVHSDTAVVLWTRFAPGAVASVELSWQVATDPAFTRVVRSGTGVASPETDGCVKVLADGLAQGTIYWYRFLVAGSAGPASPAGRTRTLPSPGSQPAEVRLAVASCQNFPAGYYTAWRAIAEADLDAVIFLGDYIYESAGPGAASPTVVRADRTLRADDLGSYRAKYRAYRSDPDLRLAHAMHPFAPVWDDHEFVNDYNRTTILAFPDRAAAAYRAWFDYQPVWRIDGDRIHRRLRWGRLVDLAMLDTRQYRDPHVVGPDGETLKFGSTVDPPLSEVHSVGRTILGDTQRDWFLDGFGAAQDDGVTWKLVANQVMISPIRAIDLDSPALRALRPDLVEHAGVYVNFDDWSGYMWERDVVTDRLHSDAISNVGFLTGDIHSFWQAPVRRDFDEPFSPIVAQEFVCGSVSSRGFDQVAAVAPAIEDALRNFSPGFRYVDLVRRGFGLVRCSPTAATVEFQVVDATRPAPAATPGSPGPVVSRPSVRFDWPAGSTQLTQGV